MELPTYNPFKEKDFRAHEMLDNIEMRLVWDHHTEVVQATQIDDGVVKHNGEATQGEFNGYRERDAFTMVRNWGGTKHYRLIVDLHLKLTHFSPNFASKVDPRLRHNPT